MNSEPQLNNGCAQSPEEHALSCWAALEKHVTQPDLFSQRCGCYRHSVAGHIVIFKGCEVGDMLAEEYEIASRRVRERSSHKVIHPACKESRLEPHLEPGDMGSTLDYPG